MPRATVVGLGVALAASIGYVQLLAAPPESVAAQAATPTPQRALLDRYCVGCHNERTLTGGLALDVTDITDVSQAPEIWEKVVQKLRGGLMPPGRRPRPDTGTYNEFRRWVEAELDRAAEGVIEPGRVPTHRLNRAEYTNAIRDLLALDVDGESLLPARCGRPRLRQPRGHTGAGAVPDGSLHVRGPPDQPPRRGRPGDRAGVHIQDVRRADQHDAERPDERGSAVRITCRHRDSSPLPA